MRLVLAAMAAVVCMCGVAQGEIPQVMGYQGRVSDNSGVPVSDGVYDMRFRIYDNSGGSGSPLWDSGTRSVTLTGGVFSVVLGESPQPSLNLTFDRDYWMLVTFDNEDQSPPKQLGSAGYAYMASGLVPGTVVMGDVTTGPSAAVAGVNTATTGVNYGVRGTTASTEGWAVYGDATAASGMTCGLAGVSTSTEGRGVLGIATATLGNTHGVYGMIASTGGSAVFASATATSGVNAGVYGRSMSPDGRGVHGQAQAGAGYAHGVFGESASTDGYGVYGYASAGSGWTEGVHGLSVSTFGTGVYGEASAGTGITRGGWFRSNSTSGKGVHGVATATTGSGEGVWGQSWSASGIGVHGWNNAGGYGLFATGDIGATGSKSCVVRTSQGPTRLYCQESPECWFEDFGEGRLINGKCHVELDPLFLETVTIDAANPMRVFVQLHDRTCEGVAVERGATGFDVIELRNGASDGTFDFRVVAKRTGFEQKRLDHSAAPEQDPYLHPELRERLLREHQEELARLEEERAGLG